MNQCCRSSFVLIAAVAIIALGWLAVASPKTEEPRDHHDASANRLAVVWTSGDPDVAHRMALMYTHGAQRRGWFDEVRLIVWGPSQRLLVGDQDIQAKIAELQSDGVKVQACLACADTYGIAEKLRELDLEVKYMGQPLSDHLKSPDWHVLTF